MSSAHPVSTTGRPPGSYPPPGLRGEAGSPVAAVALPAEDGRRRRPPAGPALK